MATDAPRTVIALVGVLAPGPGLGCSAQEAGGPYAAVISQMRGLTELEQPDAVTLAELDGSVGVAAFSSRGQPLVALRRNSPVGGGDFTVRWVR
jgi:hypothetical protein